MKILVIAPTPFFANRGTHIRILEQVLALEKLNYKIEIVTYHIGQEIDQFTKIIVKRILPLFFWYKKLEAGPSWQKIFLDFQLVIKTLIETIRFKPQILHCHLHEGVLIGWLVKKILFWQKINIISDFHSSLTKEMVAHQFLKTKRTKNKWQKIENFIIKLGDRVITSSEEYANDINCGDLKTAIPILDGVNLDSYQINLNKQELRKKYNLPLDKFLIIYTGGCLPGKGLSYLLEAIPKVLEKNNQICFVIAGYPIKYAKDFFKKYNLNQDQIRYFEPLEYKDLPEVLLASDLGVEPKRISSGQASGKLLNYMAAGLPIICFKNINNFSTLGDDYYYSEVSSQGIEKTIDYFYSNPELRNKLSEISKSKSYGFANRIIGVRLDQLYKELL